MGIVITQVGRETFEAVVCFNYLRRKRRFISSQAARAWATRKYNEMVAGTEQQTALKQRRDMTLERFISTYLREYSTNSRDRINVKPLTKYLGGESLSAFISGTHLIKRYIARRLKEQRANKTVNIEIDALRHILRVAAQQNYVEPTTIDFHRLHLTTNHRERVLSDEEIVLLREALPDFLRDFFNFCLLTGLRFGDAARISEQHINYEQGTLVIQQQKTNKPLAIPIVPVVADIIARHKDNLDGGGYLFRNRAGTIIKQRGMWKALQVAKRKAGIKDLHWHDLRHTLATTLSESNFSHQTVAALLGDTPKVARIYTNISLQHRRKAVQSVADRLAHITRRKSPISDDKPPAEGS